MNSVTLSRLVAPNPNHFVVLAVRGDSATTGRWKIDQLATGLFGAVTRKKHDLEVSVIVAEVLMPDLPER